MKPHWCCLITSNNLVHLLLRITRAKDLWQNNTLLFGCCGVTSRWWLDGITDSMDCESEQALGVDDGQGSLVCCSPWGCKESDTTEQLNWTESFLCISLGEKKMYVHSFKNIYWILWSFPSGSDSKESACNSGDPGLIHGFRWSPGEGNGNPLQYSCLENFMDSGKVSDMTEWPTLSTTFQYNILEQSLANYSHRPNLASWLFFVNKVLLEHSLVHTLTYCLW